MFGRDPVLPLNTLLGPKMRYLGYDINILLLEAMKNMFEIVATNLKMAQERGDPKSDPLPNKLQLVILYWSKIILKDPLIPSM